MALKVGVECVKGRLRLRLPRQLFGGQQKYLSLGLDDSPMNQGIAAAKKQLIEADILLGQFDPSLVRYQERKTQPKTKGKAVGVYDLWVKYVEYQKPSLSPKTIADTFAPITKVLANAPQLLDQPLEVRSYLLRVTTEQQCRRALMHLSAACKWGLKHGLVEANLFDGLYRELPKPRYQIEELANPFTEAERDRIIEAFENHQPQVVNGHNYSYYTNFVRFLFYVGCRPSEAVGLRWKHVSDDCSKIRFTAAIVKCAGRHLTRDRTKTGKPRNFPCNAAVQAFLKELKARSCDTSPDALVFPSPKGKPINYNNFCGRAWKTITKSLGLESKNGMSTTPYNCRDTFITLQALKGHSSDLIGAWCGNSAETIRKHYLSRLALERVLPSE
ncbi:MAG: tyrosine-type recombinase/integrase [Leptolyngbya sp. BL-A-14]